MSIKLKVSVYLEDNLTPIDDVKIVLNPVDIKDSSQPKDKPQEQVSQNGEIIFNMPTNANKFEFDIVDDRFYKKAKNDIVRVVNNYNNNNNAIVLNIVPKIWLYFDGKKIHICRGNKIINLFVSFSGKALNYQEMLEMKNNQYENFVPYINPSNNTVFYFCLDKKWQKELNVGALPEGIYYIDITPSTKSKASGVRNFEQGFLSKTIKGNIEDYWGQKNIPIYTDKECKNTTENDTQRSNFYIHGGKEYGDAGGIDLAQESDDFFRVLQGLQHPHPNYKDEDMAIKLVVDYASIYISPQRIELTRYINITQDNRCSQQKHIVILNAIYGNKPQHTSQEAFNAQKLQTCWRYKEILQTEKFNFEEVELESLTLFKKGEMEYRGENIEIDLVEYNWHNYNKQIIVFGFLDTDISVSTDGKRILKNAKYRIITWHNPIVNPRVTLFSFMGNYNPAIGMFGEIQGRKFEVHKALDFFAPSGTSVYAPLDCEVFATSEETIQGQGYGNSITLKVTGLSLEILKIRRAHLDYSLACEDKGEKPQGEDFDEDSTSYYLFYAHLSKINVKKGDKVVAGQLMGFSGTTGNAKDTRAPHLHFEIRSDNNTKTRSLKYLVNPAFYIEFKKPYGEFSQEEKEEQQKICKEISNNANGFCILK